MTRDLRGDARRILRAALAAVEPRAAVRRALRLDGETLVVGGGERIGLGSVRRIVLIGAGKAAAGMALGALDVLGERISGGTITTTPGRAAEVPGMEVWEAGHPVPDAHGLAGAASALAAARAAERGDLVLCLLSGGASALWPAPPAGVGVTEVGRVTEALLRAGAPIRDLNAVRKHLSRIGGGGLARAAWPARVVSLVMSDVVGSAPETIASGPTVADPTTYADALEVLRRYEIDAPPAIRAHLAAGAAGERPETLKPGEPAALSSTAHLVAENRTALEGAAREAAALGYRAEVVADDLEGEARDRAHGLAALALGRRDALAAGDPPRALLLGGETTVTVAGRGRGGRNQELALALACELEDEARVAAAAMGTDGVDGPTAAAGGIVDGGTVARGEARGGIARDALFRNDSHTFLAASGDLLVTGPTGTNVGDVVVLLVEGTGNRE